MIKIGDCVTIHHNATNYNGGAIPPHAYNMTWVVRSIADTRCVLGQSRDNPNISLNLPIDVKYLDLTM